MTIRTLYGVLPALLLATTVLYAAPLPEYRKATPSPRSFQSTSNGIAFDRHLFMPVSEVRPGMRGYALTVFKGTKIEKFHVEILGVVSKFNEGQDYILFRALDGPPVTAGLNIAHGMSGSPIYINGRLAGAISMGIPGTDFPRDPIALATPIEAMFDSWNPKLPTAAHPISATSSELDSLASTGQDFTELPIPVSVSGLSARGVVRMAKVLAPYHMEVIAGGGAPGTESAFARTATLQPGSAVGVSLVQGDVDLTATGTVTYRQGSRLLLFGHPFTDYGPLDAALTTAYVVNIIPSFESSVKLGEPLTTVGRITQDRPFSVGATIGPLPQMVPITVYVDDQTSQTAKTFHVRVINHPLLTGSLVSEVTNLLVEEVHGQPGDCVADVTVDADVNGYGHIVRTNRFFDDVDIGEASIGDLDSLVRTVTTNQFSPKSLRSVRFNIVLHRSHDTATLDRIFVSKTSYRPGDIIPVEVVIHPFEQPAEDRTINVKIPNDTANGTLTLSVRGGASSTSGQSSNIGTIIIIRSQDSSGSDIATNFPQLVKNYLDQPKNNQLVARLELPTYALVVNGTKLSKLPSGMADVIQATRMSSLRTTRDEVKVIETVPYVVAGSQSLTVTIESKIPSEPGAAATKSSGTDSSAIGPAQSSSSANADNTVFSAGSVDKGQDTGSTPYFVIQNSGSNENNSTPGLPLPLSPIEAPALNAQSGTRSSSGTAVADGAGSIEPVASTPAPASGAPNSVVRSVLLWHQSTQSDFLPGDLQGLSLSNKGGISFAGTLFPIGDTSSNYLWSLTGDGIHGLYAGGGDDGTIYHFTPSGTLPYYHSPDLEIPTMATDSSGNLYAAGIPSGKVYKVEAANRGHVWFQPSEPYVTSLLYDGMNDLLYAGTGGGSADLYRIPAAGPLPTRPVLKTKETQILALAVDSAGDVYAGTAPSGLVYRLTPNGEFSVYWSAPETNITGLCVSPSNIVYASTGPRGNIYRLDSDGTAAPILDKAVAGLTGLSVNRAGIVTACAGNVVYRIEADDTVDTTSGPEGQRYISIAQDKRTGYTYLGTATVGALYGLTGRSTAAAGADEYTSQVRDGGALTRWGTITWMTEPEVIPNSTIYFQTRSGDTAQPDESWSPWSSPIGASGSTIGSPVARYLQYRAVFELNPKPSISIVNENPIPFPDASPDSDLAKSATSPVLRSVTISYLPRTQGPKVRLIKPDDSAPLSGAQLIQWSVQNPDKDTLSYSLFYSVDSGATWKALSKKGTPSGTETSSEAVVASPGVIPPKAKMAPTVTDPEAEETRMKKDLDSHPEIPAAVRDQILAQAPSVIRIEVDPDGPAAPAPTDNPDLTATSFTWDTTEVRDGEVLIKVVATDRPGNAVDYKTDTFVSSSLLIVNSPPTVSLEPATVDKDGTVTVLGTATAALDSPLNPIQAIQFKVDGRSPLAAAPSNGLFDQPIEEFVAKTTPLSKGPHTIVIQAQDRAGNWKVEPVKVTVL